MKRFFLFILIVIITITNGYSNGTKEDKDSMMDDDTMMMLPDEHGFYSTQELQPRVLPFTSEADAIVLAQKGKVVYYFAATWCPNCQAAYKNLNKDEIPDDVTIILVNYDNSSTLKSKFGIVMQHTFVQIGPMGEKKAIWTGSNTVKDILNHLVD